MDDGGLNSFSRVIQDSNYSVTINGYLYSGSCFPDPVKTSITPESPRLRHPGTHSEKLLQSKYRRNRGVETVDVI